MILINNEARHYCYPSIITLRILVEAYDCFDYHHKVLACLLVGELNTAAKLGA